MDNNFWDNLGAGTQPVSFFEKTKSLGRAIRGDGLYPGEKHALLKMPNGTFERGNYIGPGTHIVQRLLYDKSPPKTEVDKVAIAHDLRYGFAENTDDARKADNIMINKVNEIQRNHLDSNFNIAQAKLIAAKVALEDLGIMNKGSFAGLDQPKEYNDSQKVELEKVLEQVKAQY